MLTEICQYLRNWFDRKPDGSEYPKYYGDFTINNGAINAELADGQYYRIIGSSFNDGVHQFPNDFLTDESFNGSVWVMVLPPSLVSLAAEINQWQEQYGAVNSPALSPYQSESFGGYSYSKSSGGSGAGDAGTWQSVYGSRLNMWRKV